MNLVQVERHLIRIWGRRAWAQFRGPEHHECAGGYGSAGAGYSFDGQRRPADPQRPQIQLQITLAGQGRFRDAAGRENILSPGRAFLVVVPSVHQYWFPNEGPWRFVWCWLRHPWATEVLSRLSQDLGQVPGTPVDDGVLTALLVHQRLLAASRAADPWAMEAAVLALTVALQRFGEHAVSGGERLRLRAVARALVASDPAHPPTVADLARQEGCSPTALAQRFRAAVGEPPSAVMLAARLDLLREALVNDDAPVGELAARFGFAATNHCCRVFRQRFGTTPARYRRHVDPVGRW